MQNTQNFHYEFFDFSAATALEVAEKHLVQIIAQDRLAAIFRPNAVVVMVAPNDEFHQLGKDWEERVRRLGWSTYNARERDDALLWLRRNFPTPALEELETQIVTAEPAS